MKLINQSWSWIQRPLNPEVIAEQAGRTCYKSEANITSDSANKFVKSIIKRGHETVIEHVSASVRIITNRGVSHELVRHRLSSFSQESTRYVKYGQEGMEFIIPVWWDDWSEDEQLIFKCSCINSAADYSTLISNGSKPEEAREVLNNALKTELVMTANMREWRHVFNLRCSQKAHPQIRALMLDMLKQFYNVAPAIFEDLVIKYKLL